MDDNTKQDDPRQDAQRFGEYEVLHDGGGTPVLLGSGSYGRTYKARSEWLGTEVAIKVIRRDLTASESVRQRFLREGRALARLAHDHIALLRNFGRSEDGQLYFVMDYCAGGTLAERVKQLGPRPPGEALEVVRQVASALVAAHAADIIHRDLKPGNIMLAQMPPPLRVKVIDFGLALSSGTGVAGGRFHGTAQWASPEQLREQVLDGRSDLFSLGLVLWFLLEGRAPDDGSKEDVMDLRLAPGGYAERLPQGLPQGIRELLAHLLETDPDQRPASASQLVAYLDALRETYPYEPPAALLAEPEQPAGTGLPVRTGTIPYRPLTGLHRDLAGKWFEVRPEAGPGARIEFILDEKRAATPGLWARVQANLERLWRQPVAGLPRFSVIYETHGVWVAEFEGTSGGDLNSWLEREKKVKLGDALGFLARVAGVADDAHACGLPGLGLMAEQVRWESGCGNDGGGSLRGAIPRLFPLLLGAADVPEGNVVSDDPHGSTLVLVGPELACNRHFMLARLIYQMVCGRRPPDAVAYSRSAYITVSALSEQGNAILREAFLRQGPWDSCRELLEDLATTENLSLRASGSGSTPPTSGGSAGTSSTREPPPQPPPDVPLVSPPVSILALEAARQRAEIARQQEEEDQRRQQVEEARQAQAAAARAQMERQEAEERQRQAAAKAAADLAQRKAADENARQQEESARLARETAARQQLEMDRQEAVKRQRQAEALAAADIAQRQPLGPGPGAWWVLLGFVGLVMAGFFLLVLLKGGGKPGSLADQADRSHKSDTPVRVAVPQTKTPQPLTGSVTLTSTPNGAAIWRDGSNTGHITKHTFDKVSPGFVSYTLKLQGYEDITVSDSVVAGRELPLSATLKPKPKACELTLAAGKAWENPLGMRFVAAGTPGVYFCVWETRVRDFRVFVDDSRYDAISDGPNGAPAYTLEKDGKGGAWKQAGGTWKDPHFPPDRGQNELHPVVCVSYLDAEAFCDWLTKRDKDVLPNGWRYRLPTDGEWSTACGTDEFPWGDRYPPGRTAGNYCGTEAMIGAYQGCTNDLVKAGFTDGWPRTAPVGSFAKNRYGVYDMGGNVWEWCATWYQSSMNTAEALKAFPVLKDDGGGQMFRVVRGASWNFNERVLMRSASRIDDSPRNRDDDYGFRVVLGGGGG